MEKKEKTLDLIGVSRYTIIVCGIGGNKMLSQLSATSKVVGVKQSAKAIKSGRADRVYIALDAEQRVLRPICELCRQMQVEVEEVATMAELGDACMIDVGAAVVTVLTE